MQTDLSVAGEDVDNALTFSSQSNDITSRSTTTAVVSWPSVPSWLTVGETGPDQRTPNIASVVQEIVDRSGWSSGNSLALIITGTGERAAESFDGDPSAAPLLHVEYSTGPPVNQAPAVGAGPDQSVTLPADATLDGTVSDDGLPDPPGVVDTTWSLTSGPGVVTFADPSSVDTTASFSVDGVYVLRLTADDSELSGFDELTVTVVPEGAGNVLDVRVAAGSDDAEERASGSVSLGSSDLELVFDGGGDQTVGMRFNGIGIPQGATITNAYVQFQVDETPSGQTDLSVAGEDVDDAVTFSSQSNDITSRATTTTLVSWPSVPPWSTVGEAGADQLTPDIAAVIQEIVDRPGWSSGNSLVLIITGTGERVAESFDGDPDGAALLHIEFNTG